VPREAQLKIILSRDPGSLPERQPGGQPPRPPATPATPAGVRTPPPARPTAGVLGPAFTQQPGQAPAPTPAAGVRYPFLGAAFQPGAPAGVRSRLFGPVPGQVGARPVSPLKGRPPFPEQPAAGPKLGAAVTTGQQGGVLQQLLGKLGPAQPAAGAAVGAEGAAAGGAAAAALPPLAIALLAKQVGDKIGAAVKESMGPLGAAAGGAAGGVGLAAAGVGLNALKKVPGVGTAINLAEAGIDFLAAKSRQVARNIEHLGAVVSAVARDDLAAAQLATVKKREAELAAIPVIGRAVNWLEGNIERAAAISTKIQATQALSAKAGEIARFSPAAGRAQAQADLIALQTQIAQAREAGPAAAGFIRAKAVYDAGIARLLTEHQQRWFRQLEQLYREGKADSKEALELSKKMIEGNAELTKQLQEDSEKGKTLREELTKTMQAVRQEVSSGKGSSIDFIDRFLEGLQAQPVREPPIDDGHLNDMREPLPVPGGGFGFPQGGI
jgi:hypothetical protein